MRMDDIPTFAESYDEEFEDRPTTLEPLPQIYHEDEDEDDTPLPPEDHAFLAPLPAGDWHPCFPMPSFRQWQEVTIENILKGWESGKRYVIVEGTTGSGKSSFAITLARHFNDTFIATPQKMLQNQYMRDFKEYLAELKGKATYPCLRINHSPWIIGAQEQARRKRRGVKQQEKNERVPIDGMDYIRLETWNEIPEEHIWRKYNCGNAPCNRGKRGEALKVECKKHGVCEYIKRRDYALHLAPITLLNFSNLLLFSLLMPEPYGKRPLLILDECHVMESFLYEYASIPLGLKQLDPLFEIANDQECIKRITKPFDDMGQFCTYLEETLLPLFERYELSAAIRDKEITEEIKDDEEAQRINDEFLLDSYDERTRMKKLRGKLARFLKEEPTDHSHVLVPESALDGTELVCVGLKIKPFSVAPLGSALAFKSSFSRVLLMSATILDPGTFCKSVGIPLKDAFFIRVPSTFPPENRLIIGDTSVGSMAYAKKGKTLPIMLEKIQELAEKHSMHKGIIHTGNYENMRKFQKWVRDADPSLRERLLFQTEGTFIEKERLLSIHGSTTEPTILCGPGLIEGLDLKDDLARFNILMKLPFLSLADPLIKRKSEEFPEWYALQVALAIIQASGRPVRSVTDWAVTYILDLLWKYFYDKNKDKLFPKYIQAAVMWVSAKYPIPYK